MRPVEPDPPRPVIRPQGGVRSTTATPEQLGHTPVQGREEPPGRRKRSTGSSETSDTVSLNSTESEPEAPAVEQGKPDAKPQEHIDLQG